MLKRRALDLTFALLCASFLPAAAQQREFAGVWEATFKGQVFLTLKLAVAADGAISGTFSGGRIETNADGDIEEASGGGKELTISNAKMAATDKLTFDCQNDDETLKLAMRITGTGEAELLFLDLPPEIKMKPIRLTRK